MIQTSMTYAPRANESLLLQGERRRTVYDQQWLLKMMELQKKAQELAVGPNWAKELLEKMSELLKENQMNMSGDVVMEGNLKGLWDQRAPEPGGGTQPQLNILELEREVVLSAFLPGIKEGDLSIKLHGDTLYVEGRSSRIPEGFKRCVKLPVQVNPDGIVASWRDNYLALRLPKAARQVVEIPITYK
jgi:HSP20 family molecular chaperone IbpA